MARTFYGEITNKNKKLLIKLLIFYSFLLQRTKIAIANYTNDNTPHTCSSELSFISQKLQKDTEHIFKTFLNNRLKSKPGKRYLTTSSKAKMKIVVSNCVIKTNKVWRELFTGKLLTKIRNY